MLSMNLVSLADGRIINLDHLTDAERTGDYVILHLGGRRVDKKKIRVKQGEGARRVWAYIAGKCTVKIETAPQP